MSNIGTESLQNIRTVKAFGVEDMTFYKYAKANQSVFEYGRTKSWFSVIWLIGFKTLASLADLGIIFALSRTYQDFDMSIGEVTAVLLYVRVIRNHNGSLIDNINTVEKVFGASYEICFLIVSPKKVHYEGD